MIKKSTFCCQTSHPNKRRTSHVYPWPTRQYSHFQLSVDSTSKKLEECNLHLHWIPRNCAEPQRPDRRAAAAGFSRLLLFCFVSFRRPSSVPSGRPCVPPLPPPPRNKIVLTAVRKISVVNRTTKTCRSTTRAEEKSVYLKSSAVGFFFLVHGMYSVCIWYLSKMVRCCGCQ